MARMGRRLMRLVNWCGGRWLFVFVLALGSVTLLRFLEGNRLDGAVGVAVTVGVLAAMRLLQSPSPHVDEGVPALRTAFQRLEVHHDPAQGWYLSDVRTGAKLPLEVGDCFYVLLPSALPKEEA